MNYEECKRKCMDECVNNCPESKEGYLAEFEMGCLMWCDDECERKCKEGKEYTGLGIEVM